jgi:hypothetical protein
VAQFDVAAALNPNRESKSLRIEMTSGPESRLSLGIIRFDLHRDYKCRVLGQAESGQILPFEMERYSLLEISRDFIQGRALGDDRDFRAFRYITGILTGANDGFNSALKGLHRGKDSIRIKGCEQDPRSAEGFSTC